MAVTLHDDAALVVLFGCFVEFLTLQVICGGGVVAYVCGGVVARVVCGGCTDFMRFVSTFYIHIYIGVHIHECQYARVTHTYT